MNRPLQRVIDRILLIAAVRGAPVDWRLWVRLGRPLPLR
jgi:hypothetical protein